MESLVDRMKARQIEYNQLMLRLSVRDFGSFSYTRRLLNEEEAKKITLLGLKAHRIRFDDLPHKLYILET